MSAVTPAEVANATLPQVYQSAKAALAQCETIDECKDWSDRAAALASYAKQAADDELEQKARHIRNRAIRRMGQVLEQIEPAHGKSKDDLTLSRTEAAKDAGISKHQQRTAMRVAAIPENEFEDVTKSGPQPTVTQLAERGTKKRVVVDHTKGRDPDVFNRCMHFVGDLKSAAKTLAQNSTNRLPGRSNLDLLSEMTADELSEAQAAAETLREICETIEAYQ